MRSISIGDYHIYVITQGTSGIILFYSGFRVTPNLVVVGVVGLVHPVIIKVQHRFYIVVCYVITSSLYLQHPQHHSPGKACQR